MDQSGHVGLTKEVLHSGMMNMSFPGRGEKRRNKTLLRKYQVAMLPWMAGDLERWEKMEEDEL